MSSHYIADYANYTQSLIGQSLDWLNTERSAAFTAFSDTGFPTITDEEWRYTNFSAINKKSFTATASNEKGTVDKNWLAKYQIDNAINLVFLNGHFSSALSSLKALPKGVTVLNIAQALEQQPEQVQKYLAQSVHHDEHGFVAFNSAWFNDGLFVHVSANTVIEQPIQFLHVVTQADALAVTRNIIALDEMTEVKVVETFIGVDEAYLTASVTEITLADNAQLSLYKLQNEGNKAFHFGGVYVNQQQNSRFTQHNFDFGGLMVRNDVHTDLGKASECDLNGLYLGVKRQHIDNHTRISHNQPDAISRELYKGILNQRARGVFQGLVFVAENAQKTDSEMNNRNLLLSNDAEVDTKPQLEIYADDVKCAHGVTVGQLDDASIFYLQSRCVDEQTAKNILTFAFANEMVDRVDLTDLREILLDQLLEQFPQDGVDKDWL